MMRSLKKLIIGLVIFFIASTAIFAQSSPQAVIREMSGTVELKTSNSSNWVAAKAGDRIEKSTMVSTGFKSTAILSVGSSTIVVRPLTRLSLEELMTQDQTEKINVSLNTGRVRVEINAPAGGKTSATFQSPSATASVRGTIFEFDTQNLIVKEGTVAFSGASKRPVLVDGGGTSYADDRSGRAATQEESFAAELKPDLPSAAAVVVSSTVLGKPSEGIPPIEVIVNINF